MIVPTLILAIVALSAAQDSACNLSPQTIEKEIFDCAIHNPMLSLEIMEIFKNPEQLNLDTACHHKESIAKLFICLEHKLEACIPGAAQMVVQYLPHEKQILDSLTLMCDNRNELRSNCFTPSVSQQVATCQQQRLQTVLLMSDFSGPKALQTAICKVVKATEECFDEHRGSCDQHVVDLLKELLEKLFPMKGCSGISVDKPQVKGDLKRILMNGSPLYFNPIGKTPNNRVGQAPYKIIRGN